jgi:hypothetical protein
MKKLQPVRIQMCGYQQGVDWQSPLLVILLIVVMWAAWLVLTDVKA